MSIQSEITRIAANIKAAFSVVSAEGIAVSSTNSDNLAAAVTALANADIDCGDFGDAETASDIDGGTF